MKGEKKLIVDLAVSVRRKQLLKFCTIFVHACLVRKTATLCCILELLKLRMERKKREKNQKKQWIDRTLNLGIRLMFVCKTQHCSFFKSSLILQNRPTIKVLKKMLLFIAVFLSSTWRLGKYVRYRIALYRLSMSCVFLFYVVDNEEPW